jgi:hypothetical protein
MSKTVLKIMVIITIIFLAFLVTDAFDVLRQLMLMNEPNIRDAIEEEYPDYDADIEFLENCTICDDYGCRTYPGPCWKATLIIEGENGTKIVEVLMDNAGEVIDRNERDCLEWWCDAAPCRYSYTEYTDETTSEYINSDCPEPGEVCDQELEHCRQCSEGWECISKSATITQGKTTYRFGVLGTGEYAMIDTSELVCTIQSRGGMIFSQPMTVSECETLMLDNTRCYDGTCDFVPEFALIPF